SRRTFLSNSLPVSMNSLPSALRSSSPRTIPCQRKALLLCNRVHDCIKGWAWTHRFCRLFLIGMIIPAHIDRFSLAPEQLGRNLGLVLFQFFCNFGKTRLKVLVFGLLSQGLRPVQRKGKMAPAIINLTQHAVWWLVAHEELGVGSTERIGP